MYNLIIMFLSYFDLVFKVQIYFFPYSCDNQKIYVFYFEVHVDIVLIFDKCKSKESHYNIIVIFHYFSIQCSI